MFIPVSGIMNEKTCELILERKDDGQEKRFGTFTRTTTGPPLMAAIFYSGAFG